MKKTVINFLVVATFSISLMSCPSRGDDAISIAQGTVVQNVTIVNTRDGSLMSGMTVIIDNGKIQRIISAKAVSVSGSALSIDGTGKYMVPGFLDMHTHAMGAADKQPSYWPLLISNGITGIREMAGSAELIQRVRKLNTESAAGKVDAPEVVQIPGELFVGTKSVALAVEQVRQQKAMGADFIKIISPNREATFAILAESKNQQMEVAGHLPRTVSAIEVSEAGMHAIEHLGAGPGIVLDCSREETNVRQALTGGKGAPPVFSPLVVLNPLLFASLDAPYFEQAMDNYDDDKCQSLARTFASNGTWQVPTLIRLRTMAFSDDPLYRSDPNLIYMDKTTRALWERLAQQYTTTVSATANATFKNYYGLQKNIVKLLNQNKVKMMTGSDLGGLWVIPGFSLHQEFHELAAAGLSPLEILQMTTLNPAQFLHREASMGTVEPGKNADLVLLDANPVADVKSLDKVSAVFLKGHYFAKEDLKKMQRDVAQAYLNQPVKNIDSVIDHSHTD